MAIRYHLHNRCVSLAVCLLVTAQLLSYLVSELIVGKQLKIIIDIHLAAYQIFSYGFILFSVVRLLGNKENLSSMEFLLAKPVGKTDLIFGCFAGTAFILISSAVLFYTTSLFLLNTLTGHWFIFLAPAYLTNLITAIFFTSLALGLPIFFSCMTSSFLLLATYFSCYLIHGTPSLDNPIANAAKLLLPNLGHLDIKIPVIYQLGIQKHHVFTSAIHTILISMAILTLTTLTNRFKTSK